MQNIKEIQVPSISIEEIQAKLSIFEGKIDVSKNENELVSNYKEYLDYFNTFYSNFTILSYKYNGNLKNEELKIEYTKYLDAYPTLNTCYKNLQTKLRTNINLETLQSLIGNNALEEIKRSRVISKEAQQLFEQITKIVDQYEEKIGTAKVIWEGETVSLSTVNKYFSDKDRTTRKKAYDAIGAYYLEQESDLTKTFIQLVKLRNAYARELGYNNYHEYSFDLYCRIGYGAKEITGFRNQVSKNFFLIQDKLKKIRKKNLKLDHLSYYDNINFLDGEAELKYKDIQKNINAFIEMSSHFSKTWQDTLQIMQDRGAIDYDTRENKVFMGYCNFIKNLDLPIIFSGITSNVFDDIRVLSHEIGHALQLSITNKASKYVNYTQDIIEVFSHSFEMAIYPYLNYFFDSNNINKYRFSNINSHVGILLGCTLNDEFLEIVYSNESLLDADFMSKTYLDLRLKYGFEFRDEDAFYSKGKRWMTFGHFFSTPFYMIDYALAIIVAFQLYQQSLSDPKTYVQNFETLAKNIGNLSQKNISEYSSCFSAFDFDQFKKLAQFIEETLEQMK